MKRYKKQFNEDMFTSRFDHEIKSIALRYLSDMESAGATIEDAIASFAIVGTAAMIKSNAHSAIQAIYKAMEFVK